MPADDAEKWNNRYTEGSPDSFEQPRSLLIEHAHLLPSHGLALDLAMGLGGNAGYLISQGLRVVGVDISYVAIRKAHATLPGLMAVVADLKYFRIPTGKFDLIIDFLYLQRDLCGPMVYGLRKGGILFIECLTECMLSVNPEIAPAFLLKMGELKQLFTQGRLAQDLEILYYFEGWHATPAAHEKSVASLIARRNT